MGSRSTSGSQRAEGLADRLRRLLPRAGATTVIAVDGRSGAGKSTVAAGLAAELGAGLLRLDDIYPGWDGLEAGVTRLVLGVLAPLAAGRPAGYRRWSWPRDAEADWQPVSVAPVLVLEGVGCGARACAPHLSAVLWLEAPTEIRYQRAMARDGDGYHPFWDRWAAQEVAHLDREGTPQRADLVIDTSRTIPVTGPVATEYGHCHG